MSNGTDMAISNALTRHYEKLRKKDDRPNVLIIMTDQQRYDTINALGFNYMTTPNLDRLVDEGCSFTNAYTTNPICCPARHTFFSGLSSLEHDIADNDFNARLAPDIVTFPRILSQGGYVTEAIGKMHFQPMREHHGFQRLRLMEEVPENRYEDDYLLHLKDNGYGHVQNIHGVRNLLFFQPQQALVPKALHGTTWVTDKAIDFIDNYSDVKPFLLYLSYIAPHPPFNSYPEYSDLYKGKTLNQTKKTDTPLHSMTEENIMFGDVHEDKYLRRIKEVYFGMISQIDEQVGRLLSSLESNGQLDNTMIVFTTDHGEMLGDYDCYQKFLPYDSCSKIPMIIRYPEAFEKGSKNDKFADLSDIYPTLLDLTGLEYTGKHTLIGESLMTDNKVKRRDVQYYSYSIGSRRWCCIRNKHFKYIYHYGGAEEYLFDMINDPNESNNLLYGEVSLEAKKIKSTLKPILIEYEKVQWKAEYTTADDFVKFDPYVPAATRNKAFPQFPRVLANNDEKQAMNDFVDEVILAYQNEDIVNLEDLDLDAWKANSNLSEEDIQRAINKKLSV